MSEFSSALAEQRERLVRYLEDGLGIMKIHRGLHAKEVPDRYFAPGENDTYEVSALAIALIGSSNSVNVAAAKYQKLSRKTETAIKFSLLLNIDPTLLRLVDGAQSQQGMGLTTPQIIEAFRSSLL